MSMVTQIWKKKKKLENKDQSAQKSTRKLDPALGLSGFVTFIEAIFLQELYHLTYEMKGRGDWSLLPASAGASQSLVPKTLPCTCQIFLYIPRPFMQSLPHPTISTSSFIISNSVTHTQMNTYLLRASLVLTAVLGTAK